MLTYVICVNKFIDLTVATLGVLIGVLLSASLILWQRSLGIADAKTERRQEFNSLMPTLILETHINVMQLRELKEFLIHNTISHQPVWTYITSITNQFQSSGYKTIRDAKLLNELGDLTESTFLYYARLLQTKGIAEQGIAMWNYDYQIHGGEPKNGKEHLQLLSAIVSQCLDEMESLEKSLNKNSKEEV